jgi:hypothetical protein
MDGEVAVGVAGVAGRPSTGLGLVEGVSGLRLRVWPGNCSGGLWVCGTL